MSDERRLIFGLDEDWDQTDDGQQAIYMTNPNWIGMGYAPRVIHELRLDVKRLNGEVMDMRDALLQRTNERDLALYEARKMRAELDAAKQQPAEAEACLAEGDDDSRDFELSNGTEVLYFDPDDAEMDPEGGGWNVASIGGSVAARFPTCLRAAAFLEEQTTARNIVEED